MAKLYLVGTHHLDLKGPERLEKFLGFVRPDNIGLESTIESFDRRMVDHNRLSFEKILLKLFLKNRYGAEGSEKVIKFLDMLGYEMWVPSQYIISNPGVSLIHCDEYKKEEIRPFLKDVFGDFVNESNEITIDFMNKIAEYDIEEVQRKTDDQYNDNSIDSLKNPLFFKLAFIDRDEKAEPKIREANSKSSNTMVYIGGDTHIFGNYHNLYERLKDLSPIRIKLNEIDKF